MASAAACASASRMRVVVTGRIAARVVALLLCVACLSREAWAQTAPRAQVPSCELDAGEARSVTRVIDGETLALDGGSEARLIGALAPRAFDSAGGASEWPLADRARAALEALVAGRNVRLVFAGRRTDRYGRLLAHVFIGDGDGRMWVQGEMLKRGLARAYALEGNARCLAELIAHEAVAREAAAGVWGDAAYAVRAVDEIATLLRLSGTFQVVEGKVHAVADLRGTVYLNFGEDFRQDFTVTIRQPARRGMAEAGLVPQELQGRVVRARGWVERRGGPLIDLLHHGALEVLPVEADAGAGVQPPARRRARRRAEP